MLNIENKNKEQQPSRVWHGVLTIDLPPMRIITICNQLKFLIMCKKN